MAVSIRAKIEIGAEQATSDLEILKKKLGSADKDVQKLNKAFDAQTEELRKLTNAWKDQTTAEMKSADGQRARISREKDLLQAYQDLIAKMKSRTQLTQKEAAEATRLEKINSKNVLTLERETKARDKLNDQVVKQAKSLERLHGKYIEEARALTTLNQKGRELLALRDAGLISGKRMIEMYSAEEQLMKKLSTANNHLSDAEKKLLEIEKQRISSLNSLHAKYVKSVAVNQQLQRVTKDLNVLIKARLITSKEAISILNKERNALLGIVSATEKASTATKKYNTQLNASSIFMKKAYGTADLYAQRIRAGATQTQRLSAANMKLKTTTNAVATSMWSLNEASRAVSHVWRIVLGYYMAKQMADIAVGFERAAERVDLLAIKLSHFSGEADALEKVKVTALDVGTNLDTLGKIVTRFSVATKDAFSVTEMLSWSEGIIKSARAVGTTTQELNSGLIQLSQAMSAGRLMGDEYRSISENLPMLKVELENVFATTEHAGVGLKKLSSQGLITTDILVQAFQQLNKKMENMPGVTDTIDASFERLSTTWDIFVHSMTDTDFTKTSLNFLATFFATLSGDATSIDIMSKKFPEMSEAVSGVGESFNKMSDDLNSMITILDRLTDYIEESAETYEMFSDIIDKGTSGKGLQKFVTETILGTRRIELMFDSAMLLVSGLEEVTRTSENYTRVMFDSKEVMKTVDSSANTLKETFDSMDYDQLSVSTDIYKQKISELSSEIIELSLAQLEIKDKMDEGSISIDAGEKAIEELQNTINSASDDLYIFGQGIKLVSDRMKELKDKASEASKDLREATASLYVPEKINDTLSKYISKQNEINELAKIASDIQGISAKKLAQIESDRLIQIQQLAKWMNKQSETNKKLTDDQKYQLKLQKDINSGGDAYVKKLNELEEKYKSGKVSLDDYNAAKALYISKTASAKDAVKAEEEAQKALTKVYENGVQALVEYADAKKDMESELTSLENVDVIGPDLSGDIEKYNDALAKLREGISDVKGSSEDYRIEAEKLTVVHDKIVDEKTKQYWEELAMQYDEVAQATHEYKKAQEELQQLREQDIISLDTYNKKLIETQIALNRVKAAQGEMDEGEQFFEGINAGLYDFSNNSKSVFEEMEELTTKSFNGMTDELTEFVTTGKADFKGLVDSIVKDLTRIAIQKSITEPLADSLFGGSSGSGILGSLFGGGVSTASTSDAFSFAGMTSLLGSANGNVFNQGSRIRAFADGTVINGPTTFPMSGGQTGLMGEDGEEAIMPLKRGKDGKLGVASSGSQQNITININVAGVKGDPEVMRKSASQVAQAAGNAINRSTRRNG